MSRDLFDPPFLIAPNSPIEHAFQRFHARNPHVYAAIEDRVLRAKERGARRLGIAKVIEDIRHDPTFRTQAADFKLNNNYRALYARLLLHRNPECAAILATRERRELGHTEDAA